MTPSDRELLEKAAKEANLEIDPDSYRAAWASMQGLWIIEREAIQEFVRRWNPFADDGDALGLAVKLCLGIDHNHRLDSERWTMVLDDTGRQLVTEEFEDESFRALATRRAIVRAAAAIGETL